MVRSDDPLGDMNIPELRATNFWVALPRSASTFVSSILNTSLSNGSHPWPMVQSLQLREDDFQLRAAAEDVLQHARESGTCVKVFGASDGKT